MSVVDRANKLIKKTGLMCDISCVVYTNKSNDFLIRDSLNVIDRNWTCQAYVKFIRKY